MTRRRGQIVLYDGGVLVLLLLVALVGLVGWGLQRRETAPERSVVIVTPDPRPPGLARIPPGQLKKRSYVRVVTMTPSVASRHKVRYHQGVLVTEIVVAGDSPGVTVLLQPLDIIVAVEGDPVTNDAQLRARLARHRGDAWVKLTVVRADRVVTLMAPVEVFELEA
ncbi:MAG TPA: PDZ domain-containing protein [Limnochordales bacterium]